MAVAVAVAVMMVAVMMAAAVAVMQPIDTSRAYVYLNPKLHKDALSAARFIVAKEGAWKLYKGSRAHFLRTAPHYGLMFAILEALTGAERDLTHRRNVDILRRVPIFDNLTDAQVGKLAHGVSVRTFKKGEMIVREGDDDDDRRDRAPRVDAILAQGATTTTATRPREPLEPRRDARETRRIRARERDLG